MKYIPLYKPLKRKGKVNNKRVYLRGERNKVEDFVNKEILTKLQHIGYSNGRVVSGNLFHHLRNHTTKNNMLLQVDDKDRIIAVRYLTGEGYRMLKPYINGTTLYLQDKECRIRICSYDLNKNKIYA